MHSVLKQMKNVQKILIIYKSNITEHVAMALLKHRHLIIQRSVVQTTECVTTQEFCHGLVPLVAACYSVERLAGAHCSKT